MPNDFAALKMWVRHREFLIYKTRFYFDQAGKRIFSQFSNKEQEADAVVEKWLEDNSTRFNSDIDDAVGFMEAAGEERDAFYQLLSEMEQTTRLSIAASLYFEWDKQLRDWLFWEIERWHGVKTEDKSGNVKNQIWKQDFHGIIELIEIMIPDIKNKPFYDTLNKCRLVVNVYKHGDGGAFDELKSNHTEYLTNQYEPDNSNWSAPYIDHSALNISHAQLENLVSAIVAFWEGIPEEVRISEITKLPKWFENAHKKDLDNLEKE